MSTSGSYDFTLNRDAIITLAYQLINVYDLDGTVSATDTTFASKILNGMCKLWVTQGVPLWKRRIAYIFAEKNESKYEVGSASGADHCTNSYVSTTLSAAEASGQTILSITSTTGMTAGDYIGIELDDGTRHWTTIVTVDSSTQVTITTATTDDAASGNTVLTYTSKINRPLRILRGTVINLDSSTLTESSMSPISYDEYFDISIKSTAGDPSQFYYDRLISNAIPHTGSLYVYPRPNNVNRIIAVTYLDSVQDFDSASDNADFPQEWLYPLAFNLACELAYPFGKFTELEQLKAHAAELKQSIQNFDSDTESLNLSV
jgi:hypothetical protein